MQPENIEVFFELKKQAPLILKHEWVNRTLFTTSQVGDGGRKPAAHKCDSNPARSVPP